MVAFAQADLRREIIATAPVAPAVVNAINHALGANITSLPVTPEKILTALNML